MNYYFSKLFLLLIFCIGIPYIAAASSEEKSNECKNRDYHESFSNYVAKADCGGGADSYSYKPRYSKYRSNELNENLCYLLNYIIEKDLNCIFILMGNIETEEVEKGVKGIGSLLHMVLRTSNDDSEAKKILEVILSDDFKKKWKNLLKMKDPTFSLTPSMLARGLKYHDTNEMLENKEFVFYCKYPNNLALQGGGYKGLAYIGAIEQLEDQGMLHELAHVTGASAGAIMATIIALGHSDEERKKIMMETPLVDLLAKDYHLPQEQKVAIACLLKLIESLGDEFPHLKEEIKNIKNNFFLDHFNTGIEVPKTCSTLLDLNKIFALIFGGFYYGNHFINDKISSIPLFWYFYFPIYYQTNFLTDQTIGRLRYFPDVVKILKPLRELALEEGGGLHEGKELRNWIDGLIKNKIKIANCTFGELRREVGNKGNNFKHLHIIATKFGGNVKIDRFDSESGDWDDLIIADAVAASSAFPFVFKPHRLIYKRDGKFEDGEIYVDGGILNNFPIETFDDLYGPDKKTWGLSLYSSNDQQEKVKHEDLSILHVVKNLVSAFMDGEILIREYQEKIKGKDINSNRTIFIDTLDVKTFQKEFPEVKQLALIKSGRDGVLQFDGFRQVCYSDSANFKMKNTIPVFVRRTKEYKELEKLLPDGKYYPGHDPIIAVLSGLGTSGKSELAYYFANRNRPRFSSGYLLSGQGTDLLYSSCVKLASYLDLPQKENEDTKELQIKIIKKLREIAKNEGKPYLLLYDGVDSKLEHEAISKVINEHGKGGIFVITSRNENLWEGNDNITVVSVGRFSEAEAIDCVKNIFIKNKHYKEGNDDNIKILVDRLGRFPWLVAIHADIISQRGLDLDAYIKKEDIISSQLQFSGDSDDRYQESIVNSLKWIIREIENENGGQEAIKWIKLCGFLHQQDIPQEWVQIWLDSQEIANVNGEKILDLLGGYHLIRRDKDSRTFTLHQIMRKALQHPDVGSFETLKKSVGFIIKMGEEFLYKGNYNQATLWLPHAINFLSIKELANNKDLVRKLHSSIGNIKDEFLLKYQEAIDSYEKALNLIKNDDLRKARLHNRLGRTYSKFTHYEKADSNYKEAKKILDKLQESQGMVFLNEKLFNLNNQIILSIRRRIFKKNKLNKLIEEASSLLKNHNNDACSTDNGGIDGQSFVIDDFNNNRAFFLFCQALLHLHNSKYSEAGKLLKEALKKSGRHYNRALYNNALGVALYKQGNINGAKECFNNAIKIGKKFFKDEDNYYIAWPKNNLEVIDQDNTINPCETEGDEFCLLLKLQYKDEVAYENN